MTTNTPEGEHLTSEHANQLVGKMLSQFYDPAPSKNGIRSGGCGKGTHLCGIGGMGLLAISGQGALTTLLLNLPAIVGLAAYYAVAIPCSIIASIIRMRPTMVRFAVTDQGAGAAFGSK